MPYSTLQKQLGLTKESTRLTAESSAGVWMAVDPETEFEYALKHIEDVGLRGTRARYAPVAGPKDLTGKIVTPLRPRNIGELLVALLGSPSTAQQGVTAAYTHTWTDPTSLQLPTYTLFFARGVDTYKYKGCGVRKLKLNCPADGDVKVEAEILGLNEAGGASIGSPTYTESRIHTFADVAFKIGGAADTNVKSWTLEIDNGMIAKRALAASQDAVDVLLSGPLKVTGSYLVWFESHTERTKFLANTTQTIQVVSTGEVIASTYYNTFDFTLHDARYRAFPFGEEQGLLAAQVQFEGFYATGSSKMMTLVLTNAKTSY